MDGNIVPKPPEPSPDVIPGVPVTHGDVAPFAKPRCKTCNGTGEYHLLRGAQHLPRPCGCALRRFLKIHRAAVCMRAQDGALCWEQGKRPGGDGLAVSPPVTP